MSFKGRKLTEEHKEKIRKANLGKKQSPETVEKRVSKIRGVPSKLRGVKLSEEHKKKLSEIKKGKTPKNFNDMQKLAWESNKFRVGVLNHIWKGDSVGYVGLHMWVKKELGAPDTCEFCKKSGLYGRVIHWANKSGEYRRSKSDWIRLCVSCHSKYDKSYETRERDSLGKFI